jgi:hypothetical protein
VWARRHLVSSAGISSADGGFLPTTTKIVSGYLSYFSVWTRFVATPWAFRPSTNALAIGASFGALLDAISTETPVSSQSSGVESEYFHPARSNDCCISAPKLDASGSSSRYVTTVNNWPENSFILAVIVACCSGDRKRHASRSSIFSRARRSASAFWLASAAFALAAAVAAARRAASVFSAAILSFAVAVSFLACAVSSSRADVRHSEWRSRIPLDQNCTKRKVTVANAASAVIAPATRMPYQEASNHQFADCNNAESTGTDSKTVSLLVVITVIALGACAFVGFCYARHSG